ncbi:MAG: S8 family serine peptidase, partial [Sedimentisphaerales bacterium]|nr:S8 family serine peptidase [Sedimentisphaerales bacterium]
EPTGIRALQRQQPELTGSTVRIGMVELCQQAADQTEMAFLPNFRHQALAGVRLRDLHYFYNPQRSIGYSAHASIIAGLLVGEDPNGFYDPVGPFAYAGIAPRATLDVYETNWFIYKRVIPPAPTPLDNDVITISWGTDATDTITQWWQRGIDALVIRNRTVVVAGCGNGQGTFSAISKPSWGANVISVGAARSLGGLPDSLFRVGAPNPDTSSCGPTDDGRAKPDLIAGGLALGPAAYGPDGYAGGETGIGYSSFAAPQVAGVAALLIDAGRRLELTEAEDPRLIKALLLNGAVKLAGWHKGSCDPQDDHEVPLDYRQGAGLVHAPNSFRQLEAGRYFPHLRDLLQLREEVLSRLDPNSPAVALLAEWNDQLQRNCGWDLAAVASDPKNHSSQRIYHLPSPLTPGRTLKATCCWYQPYELQGTFLPRPPAHLALELWSLDSEGALRERLDYSESMLDNLQHLAYAADAATPAALCIRSIDPPGRTDPFITYALAYSDGDEEFAGDQNVADLNADGIVDVEDLTGFIQVWRLMKNNGDLADRALLRPYLPEDLTLDGRVDGADFDRFSEQWQQRSDWYVPIQIP